MRNLLTLLLALVPILSLGQSIYLMESTGTQTIQMESWQRYTIFDCGGRNQNYLNNCDGYIIIESFSDYPIVVEGMVNTEPYADVLTVYDGNTTAAPCHTYSGRVDIADTCLSGFAIIHFRSNESVTAPGFHLSVHASACDPRISIRDIRTTLSPTTARLQWADPSNATQWTVHYGCDPLLLSDSVVTTQPDVTLTGLQFPITYHYRIDNNAHEATVACVPEGQFRTPCPIDIVDSVHDIATGPLVIDSSDLCHHYIVTGTAIDTSNYLHISCGYHGTVTLRDLHITASSWQQLRSPIRVEGRNHVSNLTPVTEVNFILEGNNYILNNLPQAACIQVDQGTTVRFSSIDPRNNHSGTLCALQGSIGGGAAIGACVHNGIPEPSANVRSSENPNVLTAGGNIIVSSGIIHTHSGHGAGIGGGFTTFYDGMILVHGGIVNCTAGYDVAGLGSGCPRGTGLVEEHTPHSAIVALPPAQITALGAGLTAEGGVGTDNFPELGLAGTATLFYLGDPNKPLINIHTSDREAGIGIYADLSMDTNVTRVLNALGHMASVDPHRVWLGTTNQFGVLYLHGILPTRTTFFTDATSTSPGFIGSPYEPRTYNSLMNGGQVVLARSNVNFSLSTTPADGLIEGYSAAQALAQCPTLTIDYNDPEPLSNIALTLASGNAFAPVNLPTTTLTQGQSITVPIPLLTGLGAGQYTDVLVLNASRGGNPISPVRQSVTQHVIHLERIDLCDPDSTSYTLASGLVVYSDGTYLDTLTLPDQVAGTDYYMLCDGTEYSHHVSQSTTRDSIAAYLVRFHPLLTDTLVTRACDSLRWDDRLFTTSGLYSTPLLTSDRGCDSLSFLQLTLNPSSEQHDQLHLCHDMLPYEWNGILFTEDSLSGPRTYHRRTSQGCDSLLHLLLSVSDIPSIELSPATYSCAERLLTLTATHSGDQLLWSADPSDPSLDGQERQSTIRVAPRSATTYTATTSIGGQCDSSVSITLSLPNITLRAAFVVDPPAATASQTELRLMDRSQGHPTAWLWLADGQPIGDEPLCRYHYPLTRDSVPLDLIVTEGLHGCRDTASGLLRLIGEGRLWVPNAFTPDENTNQRFLAKGKGLRDFELSIYNRQGLRVYYSVDMAEGWDGTCRGIPQPQGSYTYLIRYTTLDRPRDPQTLTGTVTLIR